MFNECRNPLCNVKLVGNRGRGTQRQFCCDRCRMDGYVLRRAKAMVDAIGIVEFNAILQR
jgi:hypothetical protein